MKKQDCETKAFVRLTVKIKEHFPRLPFILFVDSSYASKTVMNLCKQNHWDSLFVIKQEAFQVLQKNMRQLQKKKKLDTHSM